MGTMLGRLHQARNELEEALLDFETAQLRYEAMIGTGAETGAYQRLRRARRRVAAADGAVRRASAEQPSEFVTA